MAPKKTLQERQTELQALLGTPAGREQLQALEARYQEAGGKFRATNASIITYLLIYEREKGLIVG